MWQRYLILIKLEWLGYRTTYVWLRNYDSMLRSFHRIPEHDGQADRQTDRIVTSIWRATKTLGNLFTNRCALVCQQLCKEHIGDLQHKGTMSTKPVFCENRKDTKVVCPVMWTYDVCAFDTGRYYDYIDKTTIFCSDVNKTSTSIELLVINTLRYIKGSALALHCCKAHAKINRKLRNSTPVKS